jgi:hypothetical protein
MILSFLTCLYSLELDSHIRGIFCNNYYHNSRDKAKPKSQAIREFAHRRISSQESDGKKQLRILHICSHLSSRLFNKHFTFTNEYSRWLATNIAS